MAAPENNEMNDTLLRKCQEAQALLAGLVNDAALALGRYESDPRTQCKTGHAAALGMAAADILKFATILSDGAEQLLGSSCVASADTSRRSRETRRSRRRR